MVFVAWYTVQCGSNWNSLQYEAINLGSNLERATVVHSGTEELVDYEWEARIEPGDLLMELRARDRVPAVRRTHVYHYRLGTGLPDRVEPVALQPQDFVDEWLSRPWSEVGAKYSENGLESWHKFLKNGAGDSGLVQRCAELSGVVQVSLYFESGISPEELPEALEVFFLVEDRGEYRYRMREISFSRQPGCPGETQADHEDRLSLFPKPEPANP